jgi:putative transposase
MAGMSRAEDAPDSGLDVAAGPTPEPDSSQLLLDCVRLLSTGLAQTLSRWWKRVDPVRAAAAENKAVLVELEKQRAVAEILRGRLGRFAPRHRKHYTPEERFEILVVIAQYGMSVSEAARTFLVDAQTISRWQREARAEPEKRAVGTLVRPSPPLRSYDDVVRRLVQMLDALDIGGSLGIAQMLARSGIRIGRETVRRYRKVKREPEPPPRREVVDRVLRAKYPGHIWMTDLTEICGLLGVIRFKVVAVLDVFSRFPVAFGVFSKEPTSEEILGVLDRAMRVFGRPRHLVSDKGAQYTAEIFRETLEALGIKQRFGAIGQYGSIAIIERFWRTMKHLLGVRAWAPISGEQLEHRLAVAVQYYAHLRPHQGLGGATPAEVLLGEKPAVDKALRPPRVGVRQPPGHPPLPLEVAYLDPERRLPVLVRAERAA